MRQFLNKKDKCGHYLGDAGGDANIIMIFFRPKCGYDVQTLKHVILECPLLQHIRILKYNEK